MKSQEAKLKQGERIIQAKYQEFRNSMMKKSSEEIYDCAYKITVIREFYGCILNCDDDSIDRLVCLFAEYKVNFELLYDLFIKNDKASVSSYEDTIEFFRYVLENITFPVIKQTRNKSLQEAIEHNNWLACSNTTAQGRITPQERNNDLNDSNREVILAMKKAYDQVYLGKFNSDAVKAPWKESVVSLQPYEGQELTNFICDFCVPEYNEALSQLIWKWRETNNINYLIGAQEFIKKLNGCEFIWS